MSSDSSSPAKESPASSVSVQRYGRDLAYMLKRLDEIEHDVNRQQRLLSEIVLHLSEFRRSTVNEPHAAGHPVQRGNCRILPFRPDPLRTD